MSPFRTQTCKYFLCDSFVCLVIDVDAGRHTDLNALSSSSSSYFGPAGSYDEIQGFSGLFSIKLENDDIQDFDSRWGKASFVDKRPSIGQSFGRIVRLQVA